MARSYFRRRRAGLRRRVPIRFKRRRIQRKYGRRLGRRRRSGFPRVGGALRRRRFPATDPLGDVVYAKLKFTQNGVIDTSANTTGSQQTFDWADIGSVANVTGNNVAGLTDTVDATRVPGWWYYATQFQKCLVYAVGIKWNPILPDRGSTNHHHDVLCKFINFFSTNVIQPNITELKRQRFSKIRLMQVWGNGGRTKPLKGFMSQRKLNPDQSLACPDAACTLDGPNNPISPPSGDYRAWVSMGVCTFSGQNIPTSENQQLPYDADIYLYCKFWDRRSNQSIYPPP